MASRAELLSVVAELVEVPGDQTQAESMRLIDIGFDSIELIRLSMDLEDKLGVDFDASRISAAGTLSDLFDQIENGGR